MADLSYGFTLPNYGNPIEALQGAVQKQERQREKDDALSLRLSQQQAAAAKEADNDIWKRTKLVQDETSPEKIATGDVTANQYLGAKAKEVMQSILSDPNFKSLPPNELYGLIEQKWLPVVQGSQVMKDRIAQSDETAIGLAKQDPNLDVNRLKVDLRRAAIGSVLKPNANGQTEFKPDDIYDPNRLLTPDNYHEYAISGQPLIDFIEKTKVKPFEGGYKRKPDGSIIPYKGQETPFSALNVKPNAESLFGLQDDPKYLIRTTDDFVTEGGKSVPIKLLAEDIQDQIRQNPSVQGALNKMWSDYKKQNNIPTASPAEDEKRKYAYAVGIFQQHDPSSITSLPPQHLPRQTTNINMGGGVGSAKKQEDYDLVAQLAKTFNNPTATNLENLTPTKVEGFQKPLLDVTGVFRNLKIRTGKEFSGGNEVMKDTYLDGVYVDPSNNNLVFRFPSKRDAEEVVGKSMKYDKGLVVIDTKDDKSMKSVINSIATANKFNEKQKKQLMSLVQGATNMQNETKQTPKTTSTPNKKSTGKKEIPNF
jgi:hypothetical protein